MTEPKSLAIEKKLSAIRGGALREIIVLYKNAASGSVTYVKRDSMYGADLLPVILYTALFLSIRKIFEDETFL